MGRVIDVPPEPVVVLNPHYPRVVDVGTPEPCPCAIPMQDARGVIQPPPLNCPKCRGMRVIKRQIVAQNQAHHSQIVGYEVTESGERARPIPPTLEEVLAAGYKPEGAERIVAREAARAAAGYPPYGDTPVPVIVAGLVAADKSLKSVMSTFDATLGAQTNPQQQTAAQEQTLDLSTGGQAEDPLEMGF